MKKQKLLAILLLFSISITLFPQTSKIRTVSGTGNKSLNVEIQEKAIFSGFIKDKEGKPIEGAEIQFEDMGTNEVEDQNTTDAKGFYIVELVLNKSYIVIGFKRGFASKKERIETKDVKDYKLPDITLTKEYKNPPNVYIDPIGKDTIYQNSTILIKFQVVVKEKNFKKIDVFQNGRRVKTIEKENVEDYIKEEIEVNLVTGENKITVIAKGLKVSEFTEKTVSIYYKPNPDNSIYYALLIAVEKYQSKDLTKLDFPISDAKKLQRILTGKYTFEEENVYLLKNPTKSELEDKLDELKGLVTNKDNLLIFYAGHGDYDSDKEVGYWLLADASPKKKQFLNGTLRGNIAMIPSKHTLLISDACFSGAIFNIRSVSKPMDSAANDVLVKMKYPSRKAMTSGNLEVVPDKSRFIGAIHNYLYSNTIKYITSLKLFSSISDDVKDNNFQYGTIRNVGDEGGDFVFIKRQN